MKSTALINPALSKLTAHLSEEIVVIGYAFPILKWPQDIVGSHPVQNPGGHKLSKLIRICRQPLQVSFTVCMHEPDILKRSASGKFLKCRSKRILVIETALIHEFRKMEGPVGVGEY